MPLTRFAPPCPKSSCMRRNTVGTNSEGIHSRGGFVGRLLPQEVVLYEEIGPISVARLRDLIDPITRDASMSRSRASLTSEREREAVVEVGVSSEKILKSQGRYHFRLCRRTCSTPRKTTSCPTCLAKQSVDQSGRNLVQLLARILVG